MINRGTELPALTALYRESSSRRLCRVVHVQKANAEVVLCYIFGTRLVLKVVPLTDFRVLSASGYRGKDAYVHVKADEDPYGALSGGIRGIPKGDLKSEENWARICRLHNDPRLLYRALQGGAGSTRILQEIEDQHGVTIQHIRKLFRKYLQRGMSEAAVASALQRCGRLMWPVE